MKGLEGKVAIVTGGATIIGAAVARAVRPAMVAAGGGSIVNFTSISARVAQTGRWLHPVSKAALLQVTRNMAMDFAGDRIRVNSVSPDCAARYPARAYPFQRFAHTLTSVHA